MVAKKKTGKNKESINDMTIKSLISILEDEDTLPAKIPPRVTNKKILEKLFEMEKKMLRMEKLLLLLVDDDFLKRDEMARVAKIEQLVKEGKLDELEELMKENKF